MIANEASEELPGPAPHLHVGATANPFAPDPDVEISKIRAKMEAGADFFQTQITSTLADLVPQAPPQFAEAVSSGATQQALESVPPQFHDQAQAAANTILAQNVGAGATSTLTRPYDPTISAGDVTTRDAATLVVDAITLGNHTYRHREILPYLDESPRIVRPSRYLSEMRTVYCVPSSSVTCGSPPTSAPFRMVWLPCASASATTTGPSVTVTSDSRGNSIRPWLRMVGSASPCPSNSAEPDLESPRPRWSCIRWLSQAEA